MAIYKGSRYENSKFTSIKYPDGSIKKFLHAREPLKVSDNKGTLIVRRVENLDTLDILAMQYGNDERLWWAIADINDILFPMEIEQDELYIPYFRDLIINEPAS